MRSESLMVGPGTQPWERREAAAAVRAASSRWPRHREMERSRETPADRRAAAKGRQRGWDRTEGRITIISSSSCMRVG